MTVNPTLGKIHYVWADPQRKIGWEIQDEYATYMAFMLDKNKKPFSKYITLSNRIINFPKHYFEDPVITKVFYRIYSPKAIYNNYALIIWTHYGEKFR